MSIEKFIVELEKHISVKFLKYQAKFYSNRRNFYVHLGLDQSLFSFENFRQLLQEIDCFLNEHLENKFTSVFPPKLINIQSGNTTILVVKKWLNQMI